MLGATGFISPRLVRRLVARGEQVVGTDLNPGAATFGPVKPGRRRAGEALEARHELENGIGIGKVARLVGPGTGSVHRLGPRRSLARARVLRKQVR